MLLCLITTYSIVVFSAIHSIGRDSKSLLYFTLFVFTVTDFSAGALPIGVKFCTAFRPDLGQVFSHLGGWPQGWPSYGRQQKPYGGIRFLLKHLSCRCCDFAHIQ